MANRNARYQGECGSQMDEAKNITAFPNMLLSRTCCLHDIICYTTFTSLSSNLVMAEEPTGIHWITFIRLYNTALYSPTLKPYSLSCTESIYPHDFSNYLLTGFTDLSVGKRSLCTEDQHQEAMKCIHKVCMFDICLTCQYKPTGIQNLSMKYYSIHKTSHTMESKSLSKQLCLYYRLK